MNKSEFAALVERHRGELQVHCYRMLGSFEDSEDLVQETFLRAWRGRASFSFDGRSSLRAWLYKIATNACLDALRRNQRRLPSLRSFAEVPWLQPYPDRLLDEIAPSEEEPDAVVVARETIELTFLAVIQLLPPRQRAVLILRDVLGWSAKETAELLETTVASANSALGRARTTLQERSSAVALERSTVVGLTEQERTLLAGFIDAHERVDTDAVAALARDDLRITMPPYPLLYEGIEAILPLMTEGLTSAGEWRLLATSANRLPAAACYLRAPGDTEFRAMAARRVAQSRGGSSG